MHDYANEHFPDVQSADERDDEREEWELLQERDEVNRLRTQPVKKMRAYR